MIRIKTHILLLIILLPVLSSCSGSSSPKDKPEISVSILPLKYFVNRVADNDFQVNVLVPPGAGPETYEPTPSQMKELARSTVYFQLGLIDFEQSLSSGLLHGIPDLHVVDLSVGADILEGHGHNHASGALAGADPHLWLSPPAVKIMTQTICRELSRIRPDSAEKYIRNTDNFIRSIDSLDSYIDQSFRDIKRKVFITYHPFLSYYARDYELTQLSVEQEGKEPSADHLKSLTESARQEGLTVIFYQEQFSRATVDALAREAGLKPEGVDPLAYDWPRNLKHITDLLRQSMQR